MDTEQLLELGLQEILLSVDGKSHSSQRPLGSYELVMTLGEMTQVLNFTHSLLEISLPFEENNMGLDHSTALSLSFSPFFN